MKTTLGILTLTCLIVGAASAGAQQRVDGRWTPWLGCWQMSREAIRGETFAGVNLPARPAPGPSVVVCVQPSTTARGVTMTTFADGKKALEQTIDADGAPHAINESGCTGTQTSDWSRDGLRLFTRADIACNGRPTQTITGMTLLTKGPAWIDIQSTNGDPEVRIRRLTPTTDRPEGVAGLPPEISARAVADAQAVSRRGLAVEDITEASRKVASNVIEAAVVETEARFNLNSRVLIDLANANVSPNVIDLMVAQSFPDHFQVERPVTSAPRSVATMGGGTSLTVDQYGYPFSQIPYTYGMYDPYYYYSYYYSPFAYPYYWGPTYFRTPTYYINTGGGSVSVPGGSTSGTAISSVDSTHGQLIKGQGYTRVHSGPSDGSSDPAQHTASSPRGVRSSGGSSGDASSSSPSSSSGSSNSGSSSGGSVGGGGGGGGRTAQPR